MEKIIIVNNKGQYNHRIHRSLRYLKIPSELVKNDISIENLESKNPMGLILGGGPSIDDIGNADKFIDYFDCPILGICLGHQLIAKTFGGEVDTADTESYAQVDIDIIEECDLFKGIESPMTVWSSHKDEVNLLPKDFKLIANSSLCDIEAMEHNEKPIYGIQFHPEVHHTPKGEFIFNNFYEICKNYNK